MAPLFRSILFFFFTSWLLASGHGYTITGPTGGVNGQTGQRPFRQDFRTFQNSGAAFDLFVLAWQRFQQQNQTELLSYFQVSGIHGRPFNPWDGVPRPVSGPYCTHDSILFPPWHRPYLALFEQIIWNNARSIAASYPAQVRNRYEKAAVTLRVPYWDWASDPVMPAVFSTPRISINTPRGLQSIVNPLHSYVFNPQPSTSDFPAGEIGQQYSSTVRYPDANGRSQPNLINQQLRANGPALHDRTCQILTARCDYGPFSNTGFVGTRGQRFDSLESIHNLIHGLVGNGGHMTFVPYAGFDPIFWLHHMNVDRLFAIFQAICPNTYVVPQNGEDVNTPLTPFRRNNAGAIYTSVTARGTRPFGYSYPEVVDWGFTAAQVTRNTRARVRSLYCSSSSTASNAGAERRDVEGYTVSNALKAGGSPAGKYREWYINLQVDKNELGTGFFVHFFLGNFADNPQTWSFDATLVGTHGVFTPNNTVEAPTAIVYAQIPLTRKLIDSFNRGSIANLELAAVGPYLRQNLAWRVQKYDDRGVPTAQLSTLKIYIVDAEVTPGSGPDDLPTYGTYTPHADITRGKQGGWNDDRPPGQ